MKKKDDVYLPKVRSNYKNPSIGDPIVVNNIADREFDYTDNLISDEDYNESSSKNSKKS